MKKHPLRAYRESKGITAAQLALRLNVSRSTILRWENHQRKISTDLLEHVYKQTGVSKYLLRPDLMRLFR